MEKQYHYAPEGGQIAIYEDGVMQPIPNWAAHHRLMETFLNLRRTGQVDLKETKTYGHEFFHGHHGRVDIYEEAIFRKEEGK